MISIIPAYFLPSLSILRIQLVDPSVLRIPSIIKLHVRVFRTGKQE